MRFHGMLNDHNRTRKAPRRNGEANVDWIFASTESRRPPAAFVRLRYQAQSEAGNDRVHGENDWEADIDYKCFGRIRLFQRRKLTL